MKRAGIVASDDAIVNLADRIVNAPISPEDKAAFDAALGDPVRPIGKWDMPTHKPGRDNTTVPVTSWDELRWLRENERLLRARAAEIAVDMESGQWPGWDKPGSYSRTEIAVAMGFSASTDGRLMFMREPDFSRFIEWERYKREANFRMSFSDVRPVLGVTTTALLLETTRRALLDPESFKNSELLDATRKYVALLGEMQEGAQKPKNVRETINVFVQNMNLLPESARKKALGLFANEMKQIAAIADRVEDRTKDDEDPPMGAPAAPVLPVRPRSPAGARRTHTPDMEVT